MDIEFHYYITYLIAAKAGLPPDDALTIAYASQYTDDNDYSIELNKGKDGYFRNLISQTMNILKPQGELLRIHPVFHFIPGDPTTNEACRKDGVMHWMNTTPNSQNARDVFKHALQTDNKHRIGIACHGYADTWAHQNFAGYKSSFNAMSGDFAEVIPNIGHADAKHDPDMVSYIWQDKRLLRHVVINNNRFLDAARNILGALAKYCDSNMSEPEISQRKEDLATDLEEAFGEIDYYGEHQDDRIERYRDLSESPEYGGRRIPKYDEDHWFDLAVNEDVRGLRDRAHLAGKILHVFSDVYTWKDPANYRSTDWYKFQAAVMDHQNETLALYQERNLANLDLPDF